MSNHVKQAIRPNREEAPRDQKQRVPHSFEARWVDDVEPVKLSDAACNPSVICAPSGDVNTHFTGRVRPYEVGDAADSLALEFTAEDGSEFVLYIEQHKGDTHLYVQPLRHTNGNSGHDWLDLFPTTLADPTWPPR